MSLSQSSLFYNISSEYSYDNAIIGTPMMILSSSSYNSSTIRNDEMLLIPVYADNYLQALFFAIANRGLGSLGNLNLVWSTVGSNADTAIKDVLLNTVLLGATKTKVTPDVQPLLAGSSKDLGDALNYGIDPSSYLVNLQSRNVPYSTNLLNTLSSELGNTIVQNSELLCAYPVTIEPTEANNNFLNTNGGNVIIGNNTALNQTSQNGQTVNGFVLDFSSPININTTVELIQMLDVAITPNNYQNAFMKNKIPAAQLAMDNVFTPIFTILSNMIPLQALNAVGQRALGDSGNTNINPETLLPILGAPNNPINSIQGDINLLNGILNNTIGNSTDRTAAEYTGLEITLLELAGEQQLFNKIIQPLTQDINSICISGGVQANINAGTNFGKFCSDYLNIITTLEKAWLPLITTTANKKTSALKTTMPSGTSPITVSTPNLALLESQQQAILSSGNILEVPGLGDSVFGKHDNWNAALSVLDELRAEYTNPNRDIQKNVLTQTPSAPVLNNSSETFANALSTLSPSQLSIILGGLNTALLNNTTQQTVVLQKIKRLQFSPGFILTQALTGVPGLFPLSFLNGQINLPVVNLESMLSSINGSISSFAGGGTVSTNSLNSGAAPVLNTITNSQSTLQDIGSGAYPITPSVPQIANVSFLNNTSTTYSAQVSTQLADLKNILEQPLATTQVVNTTQQISQQNLTTYSGYIDELTQLQYQLIDLTNYISGVQNAINGTVAATLSMAGSALTAPVGSALKQLTNQSDVQAITNASSISSPNITNVYSNGVSSSLVVAPQTLATPTPLTSSATTIPNYVPNSDVVL